MKTTTALIIEPSDMTKDSNIKREAFEAIAKYDLVIFHGRVFKWSPPNSPSATQEPVKRARRTKAPKPTPEPPQDTTDAATGESPEPPPFHEYES